MIFFTFLFHFSRCNSDYTAKTLFSMNNEHTAFFLYLVLIQRFLEQNDKSLNLNTID